MGFALITSDWHFGSSFACFPEGFRTHTDTVLPLNRGQKYLNECCNDVVSKLPNEYDIFIMNGDGIEGPNKCDMARNLTEVDPLWQVKGGAEFLRPLTDRARRLLFTKGSYYHVGPGGGGDESLAMALGGVPDKKGHLAPAWRRFWYNGVYFDVAHRQSTTIRYHSMPMERELDFLYMRFAKKRQPVPGYIVLIRSHAHWGYGLWQTEGATVISTPCMKLQDEFAQTRISPNRIIPDNLGVIGLEVYEKPVDGQRVKVVPYLYEHPDEEEVEYIE